MAIPSFMAADATTGQFPDVVRAAIAENLVDPAAPEGAALAQRYLKTIHPSGDQTGAEDLAAVQAALTQDHRVRLLAGSHYYFNGAITLPSNSLLEAYGAVLHGLDGGNIIRTSSALPTRTVTDAVSTAGSTTLKSSTANFTAADIGSAVGVIGAGAKQASTQGATWYATITAVTDTQTATLSIAAVTSMTGATADIFSTRTSNVVVQGGYWSIDKEPAHGHVASATYLNALGSAFRRIDGLVLRDQTWHMVGTRGQGGKFALSIADANGVFVDNIRFDGTAGDGLHFTGPVSNITATHITGDSGDDMTVLNGQDSNTPFITDTEGGYSQILIRDVLPQGSLSAFKLYEIGQDNRFGGGNIAVENVRGTTTAGGVQIGYVANGAVAARVRDVRVSSVHLVTGQNLPVVSTFANGDIVVEDIAWNGSQAAAAGIVNIMQARGLVSIRDVRMQTAPTGSNYGVVFAGNLSGSTYGSTFTVDGVYNGKTTTAAAATFTAVALMTGNTGSGGVLQSLRIANVVSDGTAGSVFADLVGAVITALVIRACSWAGSNVVATKSGTNAVSMQLSDITFAGANLIAALCPVTASLSSIAATSSSALVAVSGASGSARVVGHGVSYLGASTITVSRDASQVVSVNGLGLKQDVAILSAVDGDVAFNTNAALGCGVGPALYNTTAAKWKGLYSGATN
ncbi:hypothetical protein Csp2054_14370 [Curtobacterium sp. 'Ferrero']|uniref:hypothetical protein n=1 Tax=Curtobacterium sp. 'Ferrero' TaxID=2033654 RepID=UPI000BD142AA|nr:hypothetical protein [Curtobacterium sp. 'Ferrero']PCN47024.1 hypothetical protein Csp2054_14370 [Curtobacterium sp. 'Ferrero']